MHRTIVRIPARAQVFRFGDTQASSAPALRFLSASSDDGGWTVLEDESWAIVSSGSSSGSGKSTLFQTLLGHLRISPPPPPSHGGLFPFLTARGQDPYSGHVSLVSFAHRAGAGRTGGTEFYDWTARYGSVREEDRVTLRQQMGLPSNEQLAFPDFSLDEKEKARTKRQLALLTHLDLLPFLDLPSIALSNGQTRKARLIKSICRVQPTPSELLLFDEPLTGIDRETRPVVMELLRRTHVEKRPRLMLGLRAQDEVPEWVSGVVVVDDEGGVRVTRTRKAYLEQLKLKTTAVIPPPPPPTRPRAINEHPHHQNAIVEMKHVGIRYGNRQVLKDITWSIYPGDRWHLSGSNGSGKTTLLSLITGDHPQSYSLHAQSNPNYSPSPGTSASLTLFGSPRRVISTIELKKRIGLASMETFDAFPRRAGVSVEDVIRMGFDGVFFLSRRRMQDCEVGQDELRAHMAWQDERVRSVVNALGPGAWSEDSPGKNQVLNEMFLSKEFIALSQSEQAIVLFMRAVVGRPQLVILDEVWAGMTAGMVRAVRGYLRDVVGHDQAVVVVSHFEAEVPWTAEEGLRKITLLGQGRAEVGV